MKDEKRIYFNNLPELGDLKLEEVLFEFEYIPILFICSDKNNNLYLCLNSEIRKIQTWIISRISNKLLVDMLKDKITIYEAFKYSGPDKYYATYNRHKGLNCSPINFKDISEEDLPDKDLYLEDKESFSELIVKLEKDMIIV